MSLVAPDYPPPRYSGDTGEIRAKLRRADKPADYESSGFSYHYLATTTSTDGDFGLFRVELAPAAGGPGPHFHKTMSESFVVLTGTMSLFHGHNWIDAAVGDFMYVPPGGLHGFRNQADEPASILMLFAPGAPREQYFEGLAAMADMTDEQRREFLIRHDNYYVYNAIAAAAQQNTMGTTLRAYSKRPQWIWPQQAAGGFDECSGSGPVIVRFLAARRRDYSSHYSLQALAPLLEYLRRVESAPESVAPELCSGAAYGHDGSHASGPNTS